MKRGTSKKPPNAHLVPYEGGLSERAEFRAILRDVDQYPAIPMMRYIAEEFQFQVRTLKIESVTIAFQKDGPGWEAYVVGDFPASPLCCIGPDVRGCLLTLMKHLWSVEREQRREHLRPVEAPR